MGHRRIGDTANKRSAALAKVSETAILAGLTPLGFLLEVVRDPEKDLRLWIDAAKAAMPYCHQRLVAAEDVKRSESVDPDKSSLELRKELDEMLTQMGIPEVLRNAIVWGDTSGVILLDGDLATKQPSEGTHSQPRIVSAAPSLGK